MGSRDLNLAGIATADLNLYDGEETARLQIRQRYLNLLHRFTDIAREEGLEIKPYAKLDSLYFSSLDLEAQFETVKRIERYISVCESVMAQGYSLLNEKQMLWSMISKLGLRPTSDLFNIIGDSDVMEIYDVPEFTQIFRSFRFFYLCSYSLDDLLSRPWWELYRREETLTKQIMEKVKLAVTQQNPKSVFYNLPVHLLEEVDSPQLCRCTQEMRLVSPLFDSEQRIVAVVNVVQPHHVTPTIGNRVNMNLLDNIRVDVDIVQVSDTLDSKGGGET